MYHLLKTKLSEAGVPQFSHPSLGFSKSKAQDRSHHWGSPHRYEMLADSQKLWKTTSRISGNQS
jgi:hypothetical protein